ncbi:MAG: class I SAM-dependent rRNA methyltransferase [Candidatus Riflebacteria bacterium]|nr:class I SAM-dependent rRNA methyltransferase [Candidatus Riflebacteria bacterium]
MAGSKVRIGRPAEYPDRQLMLTLNLKKSEERRLLAGHLWVFSNELAEATGPYEPGALARIRSASGRFLGVGTYNRASLIACRVFTSKDEPVDAAFLARRLRAALDQRGVWFPGETAYRLINSEGDFLPGFVADRYGDCLVVQATTAGAERLLSEFLEALEVVLSPRAVVLRNDSQARALEGLEAYTRTAKGQVNGPLEVRCEGLTFRVDPLTGHKTGFYFDQRQNWAAGAALSAGKRVLDLFCYTGAWSLAAARAGAGSVTAIDSSGPALELARANAASNGLAGRISFLEADALAFLEEAGRERRTFDVVFLDPPPYARSKKDAAAALAAYERLARKALAVLVPGGYLLASSCSYHTGAEEFGRALVRAASADGHWLRLLEWRGQSRDHPAVLAMPETRYLKCAVTQKVEG